MKDANPHLWRWVRAVVAAAGGVTVLVLTITSTDVEVGWRIVYAIAAVVACGYAYQQASLKSRLEQLIANGPGESGYAWIADVTQKTYVVGPIPHSRTDHTPYVFVVTDDVFLRYRTTSVGKVTKEKWADAVPVLIWQSGSYSIVRKADGEILWPAGRHKPVDRQTVAPSGSSPNASHTSSSVERTVSATANSDARTPSRVLAALKTTVRQQERPRATIGSMNTDRELVTAAQLDAMSPNQRAATVAEHIVTDLAELSPAFRDQVLATGRRLVAERTQTAG